MALVFSPDVLVNNVHLGCAELGDFLLESRFG